MLCHCVNHKPQKVPTTGFEKVNTAQRRFLYGWMDAFLTFTEERGYEVKTDTPLLYNR